MMETVDRHGLRWRFRGIPRYDDPDDPDAITGSVECELWREEDLTSEQQAEIDALVVEHLEHRPQDTEMSARWSILEHNGIAHRHRWVPGIPRYRGEGPDAALRRLLGRFVGRRCLMCDVWEIPR